MDQRKMQIDRQYEELIQRIDELDEYSFEKRELSSCFLDREDLEDRMDFEEGRKFFDDLKAKQEDAYLVRIKVKQIFIDFNVVSFKKLFSKEKMRALFPSGYSYLVFSSAVSNSSSSSASSFLCRGSFPWKIA